MNANIPFQIVEAPAGKVLFKKGDFFNQYYQLVSGSISVVIGQMKINVNDPIITGDYEILQGLNYRVSTLKAQSKSIFKAYNVASYSKMQLYHKQIAKAFDRFNFRSKMLNYWIKKLFFVEHSKRGDKAGKDHSIGVVLTGSYRIDKDIPIVRMKAKDLQLLKKFQICLMSEGQIFEGSMICESIIGVVGICPSEYVEQFLQKFQEFKKIIEMTQFKGEVHEGMVRDIASNCSKKSKLYQNLVPLPLKQHIRSRHVDNEEGRLPDLSTRSSRPTEDIFAIENSISEFLHKQLRRQISLTLRRKDVSPPAKGHIKSQHLKKPKKNITLDIDNPMFVNLDGLKIMKRLKLQHQKSRKKTAIFFTSERQQQQLPILSSIRVKTEGQEKSNILPYFKLLKLK